MLTHRLLPLAAVLAVAVAATGFAEEVPTGTVSGRIFLDGKAVAQGKVTFQPAKGKAVTVNLNADGSYEAVVPVGKVSVAVEAADVPAKYSDAKKSGLTAEVQKGRNVADFELQK